MARLFTSGFELQSVTTAMELDITGSPTINTTTKHSGAASLRCNPTAATAFAAHTFSATDIVVFARFYLYITTATDALDTIFAVRDTGASNIRSIRMNTNRSLELWDDAAGSQIGSDSSALNANQWYRIEIAITDTFTKAYIDGVQFGGNGNGDNGSSFRVGAVTATTADFYIDDIAINDNSGTTQNGLPGVGYVVHMQPDGAGDNNMASSGDYTSVDEVTPDNGTTIAVLDADNDILDVTLESASSAGITSGSTITLVQVGIRESAASAAGESWALRIKSAASGTTTQGTTTAHNDSTYRTNGDVAPRNYTLTSYTDPTTGLAWTMTGTNSLDNMQIGVIAIDATPDIRVSALWALVEYVTPPTVSLNSPADASSGSDTTPTLDFTGTDPNSDSIEYNVEIDTVNTFNSVTGDQVTLDSYSESNYVADSSWVDNASGNDATGQSFIGNGSNLSSVKFHLAKGGTVTGNATVKLYAHTGSFGTTGVPTGAALATSATSLDVSTLSTTPALYEFTFTGSNRYFLQDGVYYCIVLEYSNGANPNVVKVSKDTTSPTHAGNAFDHVAGVWGANGGHDTIFYVYTKLLGPIVDRVSETDLGFVNPDTGGDTHPFNSGENIQFTAYLLSNTYYFDASDAAVTDPNSAWTNDANAFNTNISDFATPTTAGSTSSNYLLGEGTNAPGSGNTITLVRARIYVVGSPDGSTVSAAIYTDGLGELLGTPTASNTAAGYGSFTSLSTPTGGWTWAKVQALEAKLFMSADNGINQSVAAIELEVQTEMSAGTYYWRVRGIDPAGDNVYGPWSSTRSFTISTSSNATVNAGVLSRTVSLPVPTITAVRNVTVSAGVLSVTSSLPSAGVAVGDGATPSALSLTTSLPSPSVSTTRHPTISTGVLSLTSSVPSPSIQISESNTFGVQSLTMSLPAPTVGLSSTVSASVRVLTASLPAPTITAIRNVTVSAGVLSLTSTIPAPTVSTVRNVTVSAGVLSLTSSLPSPTITAVRNVSISAGVLSLTAATQSQGVSVGDGATPQVMTLSTSLPAPSITTIRNVTVSAGVLSVSSSTQAPSIRISESNTFGVLSLTASLPNASITTTRSVTVSPSALSLTSTLPSPTVTAIRNVTHSASVRVLTASVAAPTIRINESNSMGVLPLTVSLPSPTVSGSGSVNVTWNAPVIQIGSSKIIFVDGSPAYRIIGNRFYTKI